MAINQQRTPLPAGFQLQWYRIQSTLGFGGFGVTYRAIDINLQRSVAIKEYLPNQVASRAEDESVHPISEEIDTYNWGLRRFIDEARTLARFKHPNIIQVHSVFEQNNTAYMVMDYESGQTFGQLLKSKKSISETELLAIFRPMIKGLSKIHHAGFIHRDIKPDNIYIRKDHSSVLLDFGSARLVQTDNTQHLTSILTEGYGAIEQYEGVNIEEGPWTDIYALGATLYCAVTGKKPIASPSRTAASSLNRSSDPLRSASSIAAGKYSSEFLQAIDDALRIRAEDRPQSASEWLDMLTRKQELDSSEQETVLAGPQAISKDSTLYPGAKQPPRPAPPQKVESSVQVSRQQTKKSAETEVRKHPEKPITLGFARKPQLIKLAAVLAALAAFVFIVAVYFQQDANENDPETIYIARMLDSAGKSFDEGRLIEPARNNALYYYKKALLLDPKNKPAVAGRQSIFDFISSNFRSAIRTSQLERADELLSDLKTIDSTRQEIAEFNSALERAQQQVRIDNVIEKANVQLGDGEFTQVLEMLTLALKDDPGEQKLIRLREKITQSQDQIRHQREETRKNKALIEEKVAGIKSHLSNNQIDLAQRVFLETKNLDAEDSRILGLREMIQSKKQELIEKERLAEIEAAKTKVENDKKLAQFQEFIDRISALINKEKPDEAEHLLKQAEQLLPQDVRIPALMRSIITERTRLAVLEEQQKVQHEYDAHLASAEAYINRLNYKLATRELGKAQKLGNVGERHHFDVLKEKINQGIRSRQKEQKKKKKTRLTRPTVEHFTSEDIALVSEKMEDLKLAFEARNITKLASLSKMNSSRKNFLSRIFEEYNQIEASLTNLSFNSKQFSASATLKVVNLVNKNGYTVLPAPSWKEMKVTIKKSKGEWHKIRW